jgi:uncharacterized membrane protein YeaQ/YmgE (transglycosylase-associated protein family)
MPSASSQELLMSGVHLHLLLNHLPVIGAVLGVLLLVTAVLRRSEELGRVSLGFFALLAGISLAVFFTGEPAEELVERLPGFSEAITERHEEAALLATIVMGVVGAFALVALGAFRKRPLPRWITPLALLLALAAAGAMGYTANLGGQVRHTEIRSGVATSAADMLPGADEETPEHRERP